ncbi:PQ loop repeat-domain-containing protein [Podospora didyma]|uniref:PQ loop repeat-domain-containing protein n=1 Tax=Podospora didyma TaxID=330526 RepID=A0AAE0KGG8_9PEZI|nr:PQ loop repeat-domain-containing protein [Podospora didyma]
MAPPTQFLNLDVEAISGICGSISIACWVVVFSPQIVENIRRGSADGLSVQFIVVWLLGDVFNILGAMFQGVLPTMLILAVYYTIADFVLLGQCFYYRGFTLSDDAPSPAKPKRAAASTATTTITSQHAAATERTGLLLGSPLLIDRERRGSDWSHLSPAVPLVATPSSLPPPPPPTKAQTLLSNLLAMVMVCAAGVLGWYLSRSYTITSTSTSPESSAEPLIMNFWGQVFGWLCAALYLGSRLPQLLLNWRRKSTDGVSMLFFLFACLGNLTYVLSILAYEPPADDGSATYSGYVLVNLSWLAGSAGTLVLDLGIFIQFFLYDKGEEEEEDDDDEIEDLEEGCRDSDAEDDDEDDDDDRSIGEERWDQRPVLQRNISEFS